MNSFVFAAVAGAYSRPGFLPADMTMPYSSTALSMMKRNASRARVLALRTL